MKALVLRKPRVFELVETPTPELSGPDEVRVKVDCCGICGSDLRYWAGDNPWAAHTLGRAVQNPPNIILGHEFVGRVVGVNSSRYDHLLGRRVAVQPFRVCGECEQCRRGLSNLCTKTIHLGHAQGWPPMELYPGAYADYCVAWGDLVFPVPEHVSSEAAAMMDIVCVAVHAANRAPALAGARVLCIGGGPAGAAIAQVARGRGASEVILSEPSPIARQVLESMGFDGLADPAAGDLGAFFKKGRSGLADVVFDTVGSTETIEQALELLAPAGAYVVVAVHDTKFQGNLNQLGTERTLTSSSNATYTDVQEAFRLICSGVLSPAPMISHRFPLQDYQAAYDLLLAEPKQAYKVVLIPPESQDSTARSYTAQSETAA